MTEPADEQQLVEQLTNLTAGRFEAYVCDALAELLGVRIRKARAGFQGGRDASGPRGLMIECKRYVAARLSDRELVGELHAAAEAGCDLWVLAATVEITEQTASKLSNAAQTLGITVVALDWPSGQSKPLQALAWGAPTTTRKRLGLAVKSAYTPKSERDRAVSRLKRDLDTPFLSLDRLRQRLCEHLEQCLLDPRGLRTLGAGPAPSATDGDLWSGFIERRPVDEALGSWWRSSPDLQNAPAVLLGDEGVGKSLAALHWLRERWRGGDLVIPISSKSAISSDDPFDLIADVCHRLFGETRDRWRKRLVSFLSEAAGTEIRILVYLDGINEQPEAPWVALLRAFQAQPFAGTVSVLMSCRPWPYAFRFSAIASLDIQPREIAVGLFNENELVSALALHGRRLRDFPDDMRELLSRPRLLAMALRNEEALRAAGEYTVSRLFWEDWRDRMNAGRQIINAVQYRHALVHLAKALDHQKAARALTTEHGALTAAVARAQVGPYRSDLAEQTFSEIVDGGLARLDQDLKLRLNPVFTALALGLELRALLVDRHAAGEAEHLQLKDVAKTALEPWGGADFGASVARFAAWAAAELDETPCSVRSAILAVWLDEQNYAATHREDAAAIVRRDAEPAFVVAEDVWLREPDKVGLALQRAFEPSLAPDHKGGTVRTEMIARVRKWAGWISADRKVTGMSSKPRSEQRDAALTSFKWGAKVDFDIDTDFELFGERIRISASRLSDGDAAATFGLDTLVVNGSSDLAPIVVATAVAGLLDMPEDLAMACVRMLRRLEPKDASLRDDLFTELARLKALNEPQSLEVADNLAFFLDMLRDPIDEGQHPLTEAFWPGASQIFRDILPDDTFLNKVDDHILREALLEPDSHLFPAILEAAEAQSEETRRLSAQAKGRRDAGSAGGPLDFGVVAAAAAARGLVPPSSQISRRSLGRKLDLSQATTLTDPTDIARLLQEALFGPDSTRAFDVLARVRDNMQFSWSLYFPAEQGYRLSGGERTPFNRDRRALSGAWLAAIFCSCPEHIAALATRLLDPKFDAIAERLQDCPGLLFGLMEAAFLLELEEAAALWTAATLNWQDYSLLPDRRLWYFDMVFEAPTSPTINRLRDIALAAADCEDRLLDLCLGARRWGREPWMESAIATDLSSGAAWRMARALILQGMMGHEPSRLAPIDPALAPSWLQEVGVAAFRYKRREERMKYWIGMLTEIDDEGRSFSATRILTEDGDRRLALLAGTVDMPPDRREWLDQAVGYIEDRDSHQAGGGLLEYFLGIHTHPWLGPPGLPNSPFH